MWMLKWNRCALDDVPRLTSYGYWLRHIRHRLVRIWPAYIYVLVACTYRWAHTHYHATWPDVDPSLQCTTHGWQNVLFLNSILPNFCLGWHWYIGAEFQMFIVSIFYLVALRRRPRLGVLAVVGTIGASAALNAYAVAVQRYPPTQVCEHNFKRARAQTLNALSIFRCGGDSRKSSTRRSSSIT